MSRPDWDREGRDWPNRLASRFVEAGGVRFHLQVMGAGPPLLLLHGTGAATHSWRDLAPLLGARFTVIAPDLPGHGFTAPLRGLATQEAMAAAIAALLDRIGVAPAMIVGHSAGAAIAARLVLDGHVRPKAIVSINGALLPFPGPAADLFPGLAKLLFLNPLTPRLFAFQAGLARSSGGFLKRTTGSRIDALGVELYSRLFRSPGHVAGALDMMANWDLKALERALPRLGVPLTLIASSNDLTVPASVSRAVSMAVPGARFVPVSGLGHLAHEEDPEGFARLICEAAIRAGVLKGVSA
jgi:magnesium chelatase accessory protein